MVFLLLILLNLQREPEVFLWSVPNPAACEFMHNRIRIDAKKDYVFGVCF